MRPAGRSVSESPLKSPEIWLLQGRNRGDNEQCRVLAESTGYPYRTIKLHTDSWPERRWRRTLLRLTNRPPITFDPPVEAPTQPVWPDVVIAGEKRSAPVARWIKRQSHGQAIVVQVGYPHIRPRRNDLVFSPPQFAVPHGPQYVPLRAPLIDDISDSLDDELLDRWRKEFRDLPRPWTALLVGARTYGYAFDEECVENLARRTNTLRAQTGGSVLAVTSRRTPAYAAEILARSLDDPHYFYAWSPSDTTRNPYRALLKLADSLVVTGDSASMLGEACATGKPVYIFPLLPRVNRDQARDRRLSQFAARHRRNGAQQHGSWLDSLLGWLHYSDIFYFDMDMGRFQKALVDDGYGTFLPEPQHSAPTLSPVNGTSFLRARKAERSAAGQRVRELWQNQSVK